MALRQAGTIASALVDRARRAPQGDLETRRQGSDNEVGRAAQQGHPVATAGMTLEAFEHHVAQPRQDRAIDEASRHGLDVRHAETGQISLVELGRTQPEARQVAQQEAGRGARLPGAEQPPPRQMRDEQPFTAARGEQGSIEVDEHQAHGRASRAGRGLPKARWSIVNSISTGRPRRMHRKTERPTSTALTPRRTPDQRDHRSGNSVGQG